MTPRKTCVLGDACIICGFSFVQYEKTADGADKIHKFYQTKLKLNTERILCIQKVTENSDLDLLVVEELVIPMDKEPILPVVEEPVVPMVEEPGLPLVETLTPTVVEKPVILMEK